MSWIFVQRTGAVKDAAGTTHCHGYAGGNLGKNPEGKNNPDMQEVHLVGPLPVGRYTFGVPVLESHMGPFAIPLIPRPDTKLYGRAGFYMHGDSIERPGCASEGCIVAPAEVRKACWASPDHEIEVVAEEGD